MTYRWDLHVFCQDTVEGMVVPACFGSGHAHTYLDWLMSAWKWTLFVAGGGAVIALLVGLVVGALRTIPNRRIQTGAAFYVEVFRNVPLLVQIFLWYQVVPTYVHWMEHVPPYFLVVVALGLFTSARVAEQTRAGIESLSKGQAHAGLALGLTLSQTYRYILIPRAFRIIVPPLTSEAMTIIKNSSVAFAASVGELTSYAIQVSEETGRIFEIYLGVTLLYIASAIVVNRLMRVVERNFSVAPGAGGHK